EFLGSHALSFGVRDRGEYGDTGASFEIIAAAHDAAFEILQYEYNHAANQQAQNGDGNLVDGGARSEQLVSGDILQAGGDMIFAAGALIFFVTVLNQQIAPLAGDIVGKVTIGQVHVNLYGQVQGIGSDCDRIF